ncbi:MAG: flagellar protein FlaG [Clostridiaceae bacterium]|nr:flagellar protein FlaG [Clostridiaceae bacterium]
MRIEGMDPAVMPAISVKTAENIHLDTPVQASSVNNEARELKQDTQDKVSLPFLEKAIERANKAMEVQNRQLQFEIHEKTKEIMVKIIDSETKEVVREIPPEKLLDMFASMLEFAGLLVDERR